MVSGGAAGALAHAPPTRERPQRGDEVCLVAATGLARDWIRRHACRRIGELWAQNDPLGRRLDLKSRMEFDAQAFSSAAAPSATAPAAVATPEIFEIEAEVPA